MHKRPNIVLVLADDHAAHAIGAYGSAINETPNIDRLAREGVRVDHCYCTNSVCAPSRATILTGTYNHVNGVRTMLSPFDAGQPTFPALLREAGYQTALFGKWHLGHGPGHDPVGFDAWEVLEGQGTYHDPLFHTPGGERRRSGYVTDVLTELSLDWLAHRDRDRPFCLLVWHKAPHRPWQPAERHADLWRDRGFPEPATLDDDWATRSEAARAARQRLSDLTIEDLKAKPPTGLSEDAERRWRYQRYIGDYVRTVAGIDESVGVLLDRLDAEGIADVTVVLYSSDQGFFLGDHGWFDKRFMYDESMRMPLLVRHPREIPPGSSVQALVSNVDLAQTILDWCGVPDADRMQGRSLRGILGSADPGDDEPVYYRYWQHRDPVHGVYAHYGVRTRTHKLAYFYGDGMGLPGTGASAEPAWELYDLQTDPHELRNRWDEREFADVQAEMLDVLHRRQREVNDVPHPSDRFA